MTAETGILFILGWLRMLLACHTWLRPLGRLTGALYAPFDRASRCWQGLRRHGYLLATVAVRPAADEAAGTRAAEPSGGEGVA